jgi:putative nucleotidyltransferase with HDIG domain
LDCARGGVVPETAQYPGISNSRPRFAPVALAGLALLALPTILSWLLVRSGLIDPGWLPIAVAAAATVAVCHLGAALWQRRPGSELLFSDLLPWEWLRRVLSEGRVRRAIGIVEGPQLSPVNRRRARSALLRVAAGLQATDPYTYGHSARVSRYSKLIAKQLGLDAAEVARIQFAASLHDIGKLWTPREVMDKPGALTDAEFAIIQRHPGDGAAMIAKVLDDPGLVAIVRSHHERLDGSGYPDHLAAAEIPIGAQIVAVADTFDAITSRRPYRAARPPKAALDILGSDAGVKLNAEVVTAFRSVYFGRRWLWLPESLLGTGQPLLQALAAWTKTVAVLGGAAVVGAGASVVAGPALGLVQHRLAPTFTASATAARPSPRSHTALLAATPTLRTGGTRPVPSGARGGSSGGYRQSQTSAVGRSSPDGSAHSTPAGSTQPSSAGSAHASPAGSAGSPPSSAASAPVSAAGSSSSTSGAGNAPSSGAQPTSGSTGQTGNPAPAPAPVSVTSSNGSTTVQANGPAGSSVGVGVSTGSKTPGATLTVQLPQLNKSSSGSGGTRVTVHLP